MEDVTLQETQRARSRRVANEIRADLERQIALGQLKSGDRLLTERALAMRLGASRGVIRAALLDLEQAGKITRHVGRGSFVAGTRKPAHPIGASLVADISPAEMMEFRLLIEPGLVDLVVINASNAEIDGIVACVARGDAASTPQEFNFWDDSFHRLIAAATHNRLVIDLYEAISIARKSGAWTRLKQQTMDKSRWKVFQDQHRVIAEALKCGDRESARIAMRDHLLQARTKLLGY
jgi:DNA-binding FadR family transcriptional regulator